MKRLRDPAWASSQSLPGASRSLKLSLNVLCTKIFFLKNCRKSCSLHFFFSFENTSIKKQNSKQREGSAGDSEPLRYLWFISQVTLSLLNPSVFVKQLLLAALLLARCKNHNHCKGDEQLPAENSYQMEV